MGIRNGGQNGPKTLGFDVTYSCNIRCRMCGVWKLGLDSDRPELTTRQIIETVDDYVSVHGVEKVRFLGGEPLLRDDLPEIIAAISGRVYTEVVTNAMLITPELARRLVDSGLHHLRVSLDGPEAVNDRMRGAGTFRKASDGIDNIQREKARSGKQLPRVTVRPCMSRINRGCLADMYAFARSKGVDFAIHYLVDGEELNQDRGSDRTPRERLRAIDPGDLSLTVREKADVRAEFFRVKAADRDRPLRERVTLRIKAALVPLYARMGGMVYRDCSRTMNMAIVDPWGDLFPCEHLYDHKYGNVLTDGPGAWYSEARKRLRRDIREGTLPICRECNRHAVHHDLPDLLSAPKRLLLRRG